MIGRKGPLSAKSTLSHDFTSSYLRYPIGKRKTSQQSKKDSSHVLSTTCRQKWLLTNFVEKKRALKAAQSLWESSVLSDKPGLPSPYTIN